MHKYIQDANWNSAFAMLKHSETCGGASLMVIFMITRVYAMTSNIIKSLMKPAAYPVATSSVELIQTHVSWLFLTETNVFKLKKPVNFGFLDFSTVDRRRFYCNEELRL
ncbi:MAG: hypothetical protein Q7W05_15635, partial [Deltaproteobacteria bacterium]|nr:hypothetical protein [Deltaproteobacteria bacterium]